MPIFLNAIKSLSPSNMPQYKVLIYMYLDAKLSKIEKPLLSKNGQVYYTSDSLKLSTTPPDYSPPDETKDGNRYTQTPPSP